MFKRILEALFIGLGTEGNFCTHDALGVGAELPTLRNSLLTRLRERNLTLRAVWLLAQKEGDPPKN